MVRYFLNRFSTNDQCTLGSLSSQEGFECFTLEDSIRTVKIKGETCIPEGDYVVKLRTESSGKNKQYTASYPDIHKGMLWLQNVENFEWVYIHVGNTKIDTEGCILVGYDSYKENRIGRSSNAYTALYKKMSKQILDGEQVVLTVRNNFPWQENWG